MTVGYIFLESKKPYMAVNYFEEALEYGKKLNDVFLFQDAYKKLYESYSTLNRHKEALEAHIKYHEIKDSLEDSAKQKEINELKAITRLQSKNESLLKEAEQKRDIEDSLQKQKNITYILLAFVVIALFLGAFIIQLYRQKERFAALLTQRNKEYQSMNLKLKDSNAAKDKFMSILAHDMINPFNAFLGITQFIQRSFNELSKEEIKESINDIAESAKGLYTLLENLLKWGRSQSGRINFSPEHYNLKMLVTGTISVLNTNAMAKNIELVTDVPESVKVFVDPNMITTVIRNLVSNAIKFTPQGGKIKVEAFQSNKITTVSVTDTGMGISESDIKKLFDLSNHHSTVGTSNEKGTGLGLILCKDFVERHGGKIWVESQKGKGSIFTFTLPEM
jgi:signal transduction histidine kinase